ncbi:hypothetical protein COCC4DRAFT_142862 [Bipolaris maydis ATCC 48331]|uniref:Uncharacterized protein n=1 Tax=Cochliobolus heterostrophus (strain C4 / ATCC 48331 / race T) TaxID=665024 RepID=N4X481_COCH4|nr:uncharacterized protein COCC4DRAFT_142862 [Bipolaris maydis ATCC 48331]ENI03308.1 hypothetical protein COCC4DRAFT_142862 [Bipolaris maydis ATCC 48331]KAJ5057483.1 hypothetical protein J3E74DRAFT_276218 [Bipolaris maydis]KAJ6206789.1 hypothetical protein PSV09DRAFT_2245628 [Bipolaris maydis]
MRRRQGDFNRKRPPSWTWAGWEAAQNPLESGSKGARVRYEQPFDVLVLNSGIVQRYRRCGEERIRPRKGIFYSVQERLNRFSLQELGLFGMLNMTSKAEEEVDQPDLHINTVVSREHWINTATHPRVGTVKFDTGYSAKHPNYVTAILLSEAQYLGNETRPDVLGYPLYNIILVKTVRVRGKVKFMERIGLGKIYKYAWREAGASKEVVVLE